MDLYAPLDLDLCGLEGQLETSMIQFDNPTRAFFAVIQPECADKKVERGGGIERERNRVKQVTVVKQQTCNSEITQ